jgi:hypothetical protein
MAQNFIVLEITRNAQGNIAVYPSAKETEESAWKKYYQILQTAVDSASPLHAAVIMGADGFVMERKSYVHPIPEPEPEPEVVPEGEEEG